MAYNQVQLFQITDFVNHYVDIEVTGYRVVYSESIACRGIAILMIKQHQLTVLIEYLKSILIFFNFYWQGTDHP